LTRVRESSVGAQQMTSAQCRAARALLDTSLAELAGAAVVPIAAIVDYETGSATTTSVRSRRDQGCA
jgi:hypothetical protein